MVANHDQATRLRSIAADIRSAATGACEGERVALLRSAEDHEWTAEAMEHVAEDVSPAFYCCSRAEEPRR
jgi:hypothetical protein